VDQLNPGAVSALILFWLDLAGKFGS
jgi:hypothetical protein